MSRVWVTGIGVVSPLGVGENVTMRRLLAGERGLGPLTLFDIGRPGPVGEVPGLGAPPESWSRTDLMAVLAAREAIENANLGDRRDLGLIVGGSTGGMFEHEARVVALSRLGDAIGPDEALRSYPLSATADRIAEAFGPAFFGQTRTICSACSSGANAILLGASWLRLGRAERVLVGGADGLCRLTYAGFGALGALDPNPCRPFDRRRAGLNLGEGAAFLVLETEAAGRARGARPIAELAGYAVGAEAHHITNPQVGGETAARIMSEALARAGISAAELDYVNAHGTATVLNDAMEAAALQRCLGAEVARVPVSSSKGQIGHTLAAAGAIEAAITVAAIARQMLPPTIGLEEIDPACALRHVTASAPARIRAALSTSFGFGGTDAALVFTAPGAFAEPKSAPIRRVAVTGGATVGPLGVRSLAASRTYLEVGPAPSPGPIEVVFSEHLDVGRARRLDRGAKLLTTAIVHAQRDAGTPADAIVGAIGGTAYGTVDGTAAFLRRVEERGAKMASPADFPNLVPSSPIGHASIYALLRGPTATVLELDASMPMAAVTAFELLATGLGDAMIAASVEESSALTALAIAPICGDARDRGPRSEGAAAVVLETHETAQNRRRAEIIWSTAFRAGAEHPLAHVPPKSARGLVFLGRLEASVDELLRGTGWEHGERRILAPRVGDHEGSSGFAFVAAVAEIAAGAIDSALVLGLAKGRGVAILLTAAGP